MKVVPIGTEETHSNFNRCVGVFFLYGEMVLLCRRITHDKGISSPSNPDGKVPFGGYWSPFAGAVEENESPIAAAAREVHEESGKEIEPYHLTYITEWPREEGPFILYAYELDEFFPPALNYEHTEYGYFKIESLNTSPSPTCPLIVSALQEFDTGRRRAGR